MEPVKTLREPEMRKSLEKGETFVLWDGSGSYCACRWDGHEAHPLGTVTGDFDEALRIAERERA